MKIWPAVALISLSWGCHDDSITTAYGKNALRRDSAEPGQPTEVKPVTTEEYEPPLTPRFETEPDPQPEPDADGTDAPREISIGPSAPAMAPVEKWLTPKSGPRVAANQLLVVFQEKCTEDKAIENLAKAGATKIGQMSEPRMLQVAVKAETEKALDQVVAKLKKVACVEAVARNLEVE